MSKEQLRVGYVKVGVGVKSRVGKEQDGGMVE